MSVNLNTDCRDYWREKGTMNKLILNLGCGNETYGDVRVDFYKSNTTTLVLNLNDKLPIASNVFDEVYSKSVLEHIGNVKQFVEESMRVLKKGGKFWFRTDNANYIGYQLKNHQSYLPCYNAVEDDKHYYLFKPEHLINFFEKHSRDFKIKYTCPSKKLIFLPSKYSCMHLEITGTKK